MNIEDYNKLNDYLNDIFISLEEYDSFFLRNIRGIIAYNNDFINVLRRNPIKQKIKRNNLTFEDVITLSSEILASINSKYAYLCEELINDGTLDFSYNHEYEGSYFFHNERDIDEININRTYNYDDVVTLVHEIFHYLNFSEKRTENKHLLSEFISIYFELYAINYLLDKGIDESEINRCDRLKSTYRCASALLDYEFIFLAYEKFGRIDEETPKLMSNYIFGMKEDYFNRDCKDFLNLYEKLIIKMHNDQISDIKNEKDLHLYQYGTSYRYVIDSMLAFYALENCRLEDMVKLNENINDLEGDVFEVLKSIGIDVNKPDTLSNILESIENYIKEKVKIK